MDTEMSDPHQHSLATLSFAEGSRGRGKICLWKFPEFTCPVEGNAEGRNRADELLSYMADNELPFLLGHVMQAIAESGSWGPVETGFCQRVADYALAGEISIVKTPQAQRPLLTLVEG